MHDCHIIHARIATRFHHGHKFEFIIFQWCKTPFSVVGVSRGCGGGGGCWAVEGVLWCVGCHRSNTITGYPNVRTHNTQHCTVQHVLYSVCGLYAGAFALLIVCFTFMSPDGMLRTHEHVNTYEYMYMYTSYTVCETDTRKAHWMCGECEVHTIRRVNNTREFFYRREEDEVGWSAKWAR